MANIPEVSQMNVEGNRLKTYQGWPPDAPIHVTQLSKAGFYYLGQGDEVKCFSCRGRILYWDIGDVPIDEHRKHFPNCTFLTDPTSSGNVPLDAIDVTDSLLDINNHIDHMNIQQHRPIIPTPVLADGTSAGKQAVQGNPLSNVTYHVPVLFNREHMRYEQKRLDTLKTWPKKDKINPRDVAVSGLFYVGPADKLKCAFCNGAMMNWDEGDNPAEEHFKYFGDRCPLAKGERTDNVPIDPNSKGVGGSRNTFDLLNIVTTRPKYPDYAISPVRESTYRNWPKEDVQNHKRLAESGFYYTGTADQVRCFFCGGGLKNWDHTDDPWVEHAKWFHKCGYIRQMKGGDFIHHVKRNQALVKPNENKTKQDDFDMRLVAAAMALPATQVVLKMGFSETLVKEVIENKMRTTGENFQTATELAEVVLQRGASGPAPVSTNHQGLVGGSTVIVPESPEGDTASSTADFLGKATVKQNQMTNTEGSYTINETVEGASNVVKEQAQLGQTDQGPGAITKQLLVTKAAKRRQRRNKKKQQKLAEESETVVGSGGGPGSSSGSSTTFSGAESLAESDIITGIKEELAKENEHLKDQNMCKICMDKDCSMVFLPCGHLCACDSCAERLKKCPICTGTIRGTVKAFLA